MPESLVPITFDELREKLSPSALSHFTPKHEHVLEKLPASSLLCSARFDLGVKLFFAKSYLEHPDSEYFRALYAAHLAVWNGFFESSPAKTSIEDHPGAFCDFLSTGPPPGDEGVTPVDRNGVLIDGAHRVSAAILRNQEVSVVRTDQIGNRYDYLFFQERSASLPSESASLLLDQMAYHFSSFRQDAKCICVFPATRGAKAELIEKLISKRSSIFYCKKLVLSEEQFTLFMLHLYFLDGRPWIGSFSDGFLGIREKAARCFAESHELLAYFVHDLKDAVKLKEEIREQFTLANDSCHINDTHEETMIAAGWLLNPALDLFNKIRLTPSFSNFARGFALLRKFIETAAIDPGDVCVVGSAPLALFGIRDCGDFDIFRRESREPLILPEGINDHRSESEFYPVSAREIIDNPRYHFYFLGVKFARPKVIFELKKKRNEHPKDDRDVLALLQTFPGLDVSADVYLSSQFTEDAAAGTAARTLQEQDRVIQKYQDAVQNWYLPEIARLQELARAESEAREITATELQAQITKAEKLIRQCEQQYSEVQRKLKAGAEQIDTLTLEVAEHRSELKSLRNSRSWRMTEPLRLIAANLRRLFRP